MADNQKLGSWDDADFTEGGFFDDKDGTIVKAEVVMFDYQGKADPITALHVEIRPDDAETDDDNRSEYYKIGTPQQFVPTSDGKNYAPVGTVTAMNKNCKAALFVRALKDKGFPLSKLAAGVNALEGLHCHFNIVPMPDVKTADGTVKKDLKILVVTKIYDTPAAGAAKGASDKPKAKKPSESKAAAPATQTVNTAAPANGAAVDPAAAEALTGVILAVLGEKGGKAPKTAIPGAVFAQVTDGALRTKVMSLFANVAWMSEGADARGFVLEQGELKFPGVE